MSPSTLASELIQVILYEGQGAAPIPERGAIARRLLQSGIALSIAHGPSSETAAPVAGLLLMLGCLPGGPPMPTHLAGTHLAGTPRAGTPRIKAKDISGLDPDAVIALVEAERQDAAIPQPGTWKPWFPVIDHDRCTDCMQCLSFCLFDVYGVTKGGGIKVQNQDNCKTDCPACSRVCPEVAILFPKYREGPINGAEIDPEDLRREAMKVDISQLLGGDIYSMLRDRSAKAKSRFSRERDDERALKERKRCLNKLKDSMGIPAELLSSLPSLDQIKRRAEDAKARAQAALEQQSGKQGDSE